MEGGVHSETTQPPIELPRESVNDQVESSCVVDFWCWNLCEVQKNLTSLSVGSYVSWLGQSQRSTALRHVTHCKTRSHAADSDV